MQQKEKEALSDILFGDGRKATADEIVVGVSRLKEASAGQAKIIQGLKENIRAKDVEIDRLTIQANAAKASGAAKHEEVLAQLREFYGNGLTWDNLVEIAGGAVTHLRSQKMLMEAADTEMRRLKRIVEGMPGEEASNHGSIPDLKEPPSATIFEHRLSRLEDDLAVFRMAGRAISRFFDLDSRGQKE